MGWFSKEAKNQFPWIQLTSLDQLDALIENSTEKTLIIFKHSTRCSISSMALQRFENKMNPEDATCVYLDLLNYRPISNEIAIRAQIQHQSPQVIVWKNQEAVYSASHSEIDVTELMHYI